jgi:cell division protein DivIC
MNAGGKFVKDKGLYVYNVIYKGPAVAYNKTPNEKSDQDMEEDLGKTPFSKHLLAKQKLENTSLENQKNDDASTNESTFFSAFPSKVPSWMGRFIRNFYLVTLTLFAFWMLLFDSNDVVTQVVNYSKLKRLGRERTYYLSKIAEVEQDRKELLDSPELLEKFAREKYLMKRPTEDLYLVVEQE